MLNLKNTQFLAVDPDGALRLIAHSGNSCQLVSGFVKCALPGIYVWSIIPGSHQPIEKLNLINNI